MNICEIYYDQKRYEGFYPNDLQYAQRRHLLEKESKNIKFR